MSWVTGSAFATYCSKVFQSAQEFLPPHPCPTRRVLYFHFHHAAGCVLVSLCGFNLHFLLPGSVAASGMKSGRRMKEITADRCLLALSRDAAFSPHFRNDLFAEASLKSRVLQAAAFWGIMLLLTGSDTSHSLTQVTLSDCHTYLFIHLQIIAESLIHARHCSRCWEYIRGQNRI